MTFFWQNREFVSQPMRLVRIVLPLPTSRTHGFSLVELIAVAAISVLLLILIAPAFTTLGKANLLRTSGEKVANLLNSAHQNSMSHNTMTAVVVATDPALPGRYRSLALWELVYPSDGTQPGTGNWKQISKWEVLANNVIVDPAWPLDSAQAFTDSATTVALLPSSMTLPSALPYGPQKVTSYKYLLFLPTGSLFLNSSASSAQLQLVQGFFPQGSSTPVYLKSAANYYRISILAATGKAKINRP